MKIHLINNSNQAIGGGWTFLRTFEKYLKQKDIEVTERILDADIVFVSGATMVQRDLLIEAKEKYGKKIVLRIDNIPRNSRNRNTGTSRLYDFAQVADLVVYQSKWAKDYIRPFVRKDGVVILNGADTDIFNTEIEGMPKDGSPQYLYVQYNRDETKQWHVAWYDYIIAQRLNPKAHLWIAGNFSPEQKEYNFDFFMDEKFEYLGVIPVSVEMARILRGTDKLLIPYFNDACSQTLVEALNCGVKDIVANNTGGTPEIINAPIEHLSGSYMTDRYIEEMKKL